MTDTFTISPGRRVSEYVLLEPIGQGSFGSVWKARHHVWQDQLVAVKIAHDPEYARSLASEGAVIHGLNHPHIVRAIGLDPYADPPYLILEYVPGCDLRRRLDQGPLTIPDATEIFRQMLTALEFAHARGVIHRDIKPENVLLAAGDGGREMEDGAEIKRTGLSSNPQPPAPTPYVKLTDFGLGLIQATPTGSILRSSLHQDQAGRELAGTLAYMAPEVRDGGKAGPASDLYSAGIVLFEMLTGKLPAGAETPGHLRPEVPARLNDLFEKCYARQERRWTSAREILNALGSPAASGEVPPWVEKIGAAGEALRRTGRKINDWAGQYGAGPAGARNERRIHCRNCGHSCRPIDNFCNECGTQLVPLVRRCGKCGGYPAAEDTFCIFCGTALSEASS